MPEFYLHEPTLANLKRIPHGITILRFDGESYLYEDTEPEWRARRRANYYANRLIFRSNKLGDETGAQLTRIFTAIPRSVTHVDLSYNYLYKLNATELADSLSALPAHVKILDLSNNDFGDDEAAQTAKIVAGIPDTITTLILGGNRLYQYIGSELAEIFSAIHSKLEYLDLIDNNLNLKTSLELEQAFAGLGPKVKGLGLCLNSFGTAPADILKQVLAVIPSKIKRLNLCSNQLHWHTMAELKEAFATMQAGSDYINLTENILEPTTTTQLIRILKLMPEHVTKIELDRVNLNITDNALSKHGVYFYFDRNVISKPTGFDLSVNGIFAKKTLGVFSALGRDIYEKNADHLQQTIKRQKTNYDLRTIKNKNQSPTSYTMTVKRMGLPYDLLNGKIMTFLTPADAAVLAQVCKPPKHSTLEITFKPN